MTCDDYLTLTMNVTGHIIEETNKGSLINGACFVLTKKCEELKDFSVITIPPNTALPSYCPWIEYKLAVSFPTMGSVYKVERIYSCSPRKVILKKSNSKQTYEVHDLHEVETRDRRLYFLLRPRFTHPVFFKLLPFFSADYLLRFNESQLLMFYYVFNVRPHLFCFWDVLRRVLYKLPKTPFSAFEGKLDIQNYLVEDEEYSRSCPIWSFNRLLKCPTIEKEYPLKVMKEAIDFFSKSKKNKTLFGDDRLLIEEDCLDETIEFLYKKGILMLSFTIDKTKRYFVLPELESEEYNVVKLIKNKKITFSIQHCNFYGPNYVALISKWYLLNEANKSDGILMLSANEPSSHYLSSTTGIKVHAIQKIGFLKPEEKKRKNIMIDRFHKTSLKDLQKVLQICSNGATITIFCDLEDYPCSPKRGGGDIAFQLTKIPNVSIKRENEWNENDKLYSIYNSFHNSGDIIFANIFAVPLNKPKEFNDYIKQIKGKEKEKEKTKDEKIDDENDYIIFCSHESDKIFVNETLLKSHKIQNKNSFFIHQKICVLENDDIGIIKRVWKKTGQDEKIQIKLDAKTPLELKNGEVYIIDLYSFGGIREYSTDKFTFSHTSVINISKYAGPPTKRGIFVVGKNTTRKHMATAAKYCELDLKIFLIPDTQLNLMKRGNGFRPQSGLSDKCQAILS